MAGSKPQDPCSSAAQKIARGRITRIDRVFYEANGTCEADDGPIELHLQDGSVFLFDGDSDGETLRVRGAPWCDPFEGTSSPENDAFVEASGKWVRVPVSRQAPYDELIHADVRAVSVLENRFGDTAGFTIETGRRTLWFVVRGDESRAYWAAPLGLRSGARLTSTD